MALNYFQYLFSLFSSGQSSHRSAEIPFLSYFNLERLECAVFVLCMHMKQAALVHHDMEDTQPQRCKSRDELYSFTRLICQSRQA